MEAELFEAVNANPEAAVTIDAQELNYISFAGLRVLMKLRKQAGKALPVLNVSPEVYSIFDVTGFTELLEVHKALRQLSVEGLPVISQGATATVYRIDRETIAKVFRPNTSLRLNQWGNERSRNAFVNGIPTAIAYDMVKVGDCYGLVYELLDDVDFLTILENDKAHLDEHIEKFARAIKAMHQIEVDPSRFPSAKQGSLASVPMMSALCTPEERKKLRRLYESIPDRSTFLHADCHPGNVMVQDWEFVFIDMMTCGSGHPVYDLGSMCSLYHMPPFGRREESPMIRNFTDEERARIWDVYLGTYLDTKDKALMKKAEWQIAAIAAACSMLLEVYFPGSMEPERITFLKRTALEYVVDGLEPICF